MERFCAFLFLTVFLSLLLSSCLADQEESILYRQKSAHSLSGKILCIANKPIPDAVIVLTDENGNNTTSNTDENGYYLFDDLSAAECYSMKIEKAISEQIRWTTLDIVLLSRHINGLRPFHKNQILASDLNQDSEVNYADIAAIEKSILSPTSFDGPWNFTLDPGSSIDNVDFIVFNTVESLSASLNGYRLGDFRGRYCE